MTIKSVLQRIASWFKGKEATVATPDAQKMLDDLSAALIPTHLAKEITMPDATIATAVDKVGAAVQLALLLKSLDATLTTDQVQAATAAALAAAYPAV